MVKYKFKVGDKVHVNFPSVWNEYVYIITERKVDQWKGIQYRIEMIDMPQGKLVLNRSYCAEEDLTSADNGVNKAIKRINETKV